MPQFDERIFEKSMDNQTKLFMEITINLSIIYLVCTLYSEYMQPHISKMFKIYSNELFVFFIIFMNSKCLIKKMRKFISNTQL